jgi:hypothetical protein
MIVTAGAGPHGIDDHDRDDEVQMARNITKPVAQQPAPKQASSKANKNKPPSRQAAKPAPKPAPPRSTPSKSTPSAIAKPNKEELRIQAEKLERANVLLRKKNKELRRSASDANERVAELETMVARFEQRIAKEAKETAKEASPAAPKVSRAPRKRRDAAARDPGDAVPPGVAVEQPEPLSEADQAVLDHLNEVPAPVSEDDSGQE